MKAQSYTLQPPRRAGRAIFVPGILHRANTLPCLAFTLLVSALPPVALIVLATWASNVSVALPVAQAAAGLSGIVFLALALETRGHTAILQVLTAIGLFVLAWASLAVSPEFVVVAAMAVAAWTGAGLFSQVKARCM